MLGYQTTHLFLAAREYACDVFSRLESRGAVEVVHPDAKNSMPYQY